MTYCYFFEGSPLYFILAVFSLRFQIQCANSTNNQEPKGNAAWAPNLWLSYWILTCVVWWEDSTRAFLLACYRLTKPLSFADCVGDELPWGWEAGFDPQIGVYYIDHVNSKFSFLQKQPYQKSNPPKSRLIQKREQFTMWISFNPHFLSDWYLTAMSILEFGSWGQRERKASGLSVCLPRREVVFFSASLGACGDHERFGSSFHDHCPIKLGFLLSLPWRNGHWSSRV